MPFATSTSEPHRSPDASCTIIVKDDYTLLFVFAASAAAADTNAAPIGPGDGNCGTGPYRYGIFSSLACASSTAQGNRLNNASVLSSQGSEATIRDCLWKHAATHSGQNEVPLATADSTTRCAPPLCPCCVQNDKEGPAQLQASTPLPCSARRRSTTLASVLIANPLAELRAAEYIRVAEATASTSSSTEAYVGSPGNSLALAHNAATQLHRLHIVQAHGEGGLIDVWCIFECGCCALATFARSLKQDSRAVCLKDCVWVPRVTKSEEGKSLLPSGPTASVGDPAMGRFLTEAATTALIRPLKPTIRGCTEGEEMLLVTPYRSMDSVTPQLYYVNMRCSAHDGEETRLGVLSTAASITKKSPAIRRWKLHSQGWFHMDEVFRVPPSLTRLHGNYQDPAERRNRPETLLWDGARNASALSDSACCSVRSVRWLPETLDCTSTFPLLALLYAAPSVSVGDLCLDTLSVCYLEEDKPEKRSSRDNNRESMTMKAAAEAPTPPLRQVKGRVLVGPWSVRGVTLAHPSFLFAVTLVPLPQGTGLTGNKSAGGSEGAAPRVSALRTAAEAFRSARRAMAQGTTEVLGVFQRPAQDPYATSGLFRAARRHFGGDPGGEKVEGARKSEGAQWDQKGNEHVFAFVLYSAAGEVARCALGGYPECASTVVHSDGLFQDVNDKRAAGDNGVRTVARICALFSGATSAFVEEGGLSAVLLTVVAQPVCGARRLTAGSAGPGVRASVAQGSCHAGAWRFSVQVTQRVGVGLAGLAPSPLSHPTAGLRVSALVSVDEIFCWATCSAQSSSQRANGGDSISMLIGGYATFPEGAANVVHEGVFRLSGGEARASQVDDGGTATRTSTAMPGAPSSLPLITEQDENDHHFHCARKVSAAEFARALFICSAADSSNVDVRSHSPPSVVTHCALHSTAFPSKMLPVALVWVDSAFVKTGVVSRCTNADSQLAACIAQMDVVALLRSGDIVGLRCGAEAQGASRESDCGHLERQPQVLHLGSLCRAEATNTSSGFSSASRELEAKFLEVLLNEGAGPAEVRMELIMTSKNDEVRATLLLLAITAGPFVAVVHLLDGHVAHVIDVRAEDSKSSSASLVPSWLNSSASVSAMQLQKLPFTVPCFYTSLDSGAEGIGEAFSFIWTGVVTSYGAAAEATSTAVVGADGPSESVNKNNAGARCQTRAISCVVQLGVITWADVAASKICLASAGGAAPRQMLHASVYGPAAGEGDPMAAAVHRTSLAAHFTCPPPIVFLTMNTAWLGEEVVLQDYARSRGGHGAFAAPLRSQLASIPTSFVAWFDTNWMGNETDACKKPRGARVLAEEALLRVGDAALLHLLWPGSSPLLENRAMPEKVAQRPSDLCVAAETTSDRRLPFTRCLRWYCEDDNAASSTEAHNGANTGSSNTAVRQLLRHPLRVSSVLFHDETVAKPLLVRLPRLAANGDWVKDVKATLKTDGSAVSVVNLTGFTLKRVLYITSVLGPAPRPTLGVSASVSRAFSQSRHSLMLCTLLLTEGDAARSALLPSETSCEQRNRLVSFLLCGAPTLSTNCTPSPPLSPAVASKAASGDGCCAKLTWHWIPLPTIDANSIAEGSSGAVSVGVTCMLPISSPSRLPLQAGLSTDVLPRKANTSHGEVSKDEICEFYCEVVASATTAGAVQTTLQCRLAIQYDQLCAALGSGGMGGGNSTSPDGAESVFVYDSVDPALICWKSVSRSGACLR
ncbi:hypothetical protein ABL78_5118 [Leptomonas seymouri]|uniref:Uncharacterized protein n=1 Tax=Leptomonas seymouri TaxID=5684 RepID=A0A0N1I5C5_LEPSE|nr:hypothetical protein ABL78_5118 [Leptomonas seymouri]|eukprot:KPI85814.1 hypothetical protein ABL78_5118 [Leptomonas seymouri]